MDIGFDLRVTRAPWPVDVVLCPCPLNGQGGDLELAITRNQRDIASAIHLRNVWDLSLVKFAINITLLLDFEMINAPEILQVDKIAILDVVCNVTESGAADECIRGPSATGCDVSPRTLRRSVIVPGKDLMEVFPLEIFELGIRPQFRKGHFRLIIPSIGDSDVMAPIDNRKVVESPQKFEKNSVCPREWCRVDHPTTVPSEKASDFTEKGDRERKDTELGAMDARRIGNELATGFVSTIGPTDVTRDVLRVLSQFPDFHEGVF